MDILAEVEEERSKETRGADTVTMMQQTSVDRLPLVHSTTCDFDLSSLLFSPFFILGQFTWDFLAFVHVFNFSMAIEQLSN